MATIQDIEASVAELSSTISTIDTKLDEVQAKIDQLSVGSPVTQEQVDALAQAVEEVKSAAAAVLSETDDMA